MRLFERKTAQTIGLEPGPDFVPPVMALDAPPCRALPLLPDPGVTENGREACNAPLMVHGEPVGYCGLYVKSETAKRPRGTHKRRHRIEWR